MSTFLERALALRENGYRVVAIRKGSKGPTEDGWQGLHPTEKQIKLWAAGAYANGNVGIITEHTPAVDIDVYDADLADALEGWMTREFGDTCVRVGRAPKRLLMFRTERPFKKLYATYNDGNIDHKVEILGHGQQFVAYGVHPETRREYEWTSLDEPIFCPASSLPLLTMEDAEMILDRFEAMAAAKGWRKVKRSGAREVEDGDAFERYKPVLAISEETILDTLDYLPNDDCDYDEYLTVGMALHHQYKGEGKGLELWHEWASKSSKYDSADVNRRWESMGHGPDTSTFATLLYRAKEARKDESDKAFDKTLNRITLTNDPKLLMGDILKSLAVHAETDLQIDIACKKVQDRMKELTETKPRIETIRKQLSQYKPKLELRREVPRWCEDWVYVRKHNEFYHTESGETLTKQAFDASFGRYLLDDLKRAAGESFGGRATDVALNVHEIPQVYDYVYMPGENRLLNLNRRNYINTFNLHSVPLDKQPTTPDDYLAVRTMEKHFELLFPDDVERNLLLDWIAYNVQFPAEKITWAVLVQGVDGGGKSWFSHLFASIMGGENVRNVVGDSLKETNTSWAEGRKMVVFEEVRVAGSSRFEILNKMKPYITNATANVRRMRTDWYEVPNVTNYFMLTNYMDALPIDNNDRRYFVLQTTFLTKSHIVNFNRENPGYFDDLFNISSFNGDVLRDWFLKRQLGDNFRAKGHAPDTEAKDEMRESSSEEGSEDIEALEEALLEGDPEISENVLNSVKLREHGMFGAMASRTYGAFLARAGFVKIGKYRIGGDMSEPNITYYTRHSELFQGQRSARLDKLRELLPALDDGFD